MENKIELCLAYIRVSSADQVANGGGLISQEKICRETARRLGWDIKKVYADAGISGKDIESRPQLNAMLDFLNKAKEPYVVLFYDISRLSRDSCDWGLLRKLIEQKGHRLADRNGIMAQNAVARFIANMEAAQAQLMRESNQEKCIEFSLACLKDGWWIYGIPPGYTWKQMPGDKRKTIVLKQSEANIIKDAMEMYASAQLVSQSDVMGFLNVRFAEISKNKTNLDFVKRMLTNQFYTGVFARPDKGIPTQKWHIEPLISTATFNLIQDRLKGRNIGKAVRKYNKQDEQFLLKGFITCPECGFPLTGSRSKGGLYPYYQCQSKRNCPNRHLVNVATGRLHDEFEKEVLEKIAPNENLLALTRALAVKEYKERHNANGADKEAKQHRIAEIDKEQMIIADSYTTANGIMRNALNLKIETLESEKLTLQNDVDNFQDELMPFDEAFGYVADFVRRPVEVWRNGDYGIKQLVLTLCFSDRISYNKEQKFGTVVLSPIFGLFDDLSSDTHKVVPPARIGLAPRPYQGRVLPLY